ncbi:MAG: tyrosine-type recombinase/integrase [Sphingobacteriia bacterium]|nr:tyrosine-type recombinase/integrase [Sphingobacteriia bacterium]
MPKTPSEKKIPIRKFDPRRIRKGFVYSAKDLAEIYGVNDSIIYRWVREEGLITIDDKSPVLFHHEILRQFLKHKEQSRRMPSGNIGDFPCLKCYQKRRAYKDEITLKKVNKKLWKIQGICSLCGCKMNMNTQANELLLIKTFGYSLVETLPKFSLIGNKTSNATTTSKRGVLNNKFTPQGKIIFHPNNERIKHDYFDKVIHRFGKNEKTRDLIISALLVFEEFNECKDFKLFSYQEAKEFKKYLLTRYSHSIQMAHRVITYVKEFFLWLKEQNGYKKLYYDDIKALQLSLKDQEKAKRTKPKDYLEAEKWQDLILSLDPHTEVDVRGRAMLACLLLTGIRVEALISLRIGDVNFARGYIFQDSTHVKTKFSSSNKTNLLQFKPRIKQILVEWVELLRSEYGFSNDDPLFPRISVSINDGLQFQRSGFVKEFLVSTSIVNQELSKQLEKANIGHYTAHTIRNSLIALFMEFDLTAEQLKAVSQNISHKSLDTTLNSYYTVHEHRKDKIIEELDIERLTKLQKLKNNPKYHFILSQITDEEAIDKVFEALINNKDVKS